MEQLCYIRGFDGSLRMKSHILPMVFMAVFATGASAQEAREKPYAISGSSGIALYESIGSNGPKGAIAETRFDLTWQRLFDEEGGSCSLVRFRPKLAITIVLPKPSGRLSPALRRKWDVFIAGVRKHEQQHVRMIKEMVPQTEAAVAGAKVDNDRNCAKVKREVSRRIDEAIAGYKARSRDFDRLELSEGGNVHRLILALVND